ncbi:MAG: GAF domain-containing protein [Coleofasciculus sp. A1-SPW-01]|uniref:GAF domain-containing protein n=1 Tax=Coleofasciculus sp. A1-SPW-01 TaxID=3070819 RepID=UPI00330099EC
MPRRTMIRSFSVHPQSILKVKQAWRNKSQGRDRELAEALGLSLDTLNHFLKGQPVKGLNFVELCQVLELDWQDVAGLDSQQNLVFDSPIEVGEFLAYSYSHGVSAVDQALQTLVRTLCQLLGRLTRKVGNLLRADRTSIFLLDRERQELGSLIAEDGDGGSLLIDIPANKGIASLAAFSLKVINIPFDVYDDPRSEMAQKTDRRTGYRTYTILAWPLLNEKQDLVAVAQLINKLKSNYQPEDDLVKKIDPRGFTGDDEVLFAKFAPSILQILERCQFCYQLAQKLRETTDIQPGSLREIELVEQLQRQERQLQKNLQRL